jgi:hypothetical protein
MKKFSVLLSMVFIIPIFLLINNPARAAGATLFAAPASGTYAVGKSITVKIMVNSGGGTGINAAEGVLKYDPAFLTVSKVSQTGTIFKLWTTEPTYSNSAGTITFGGGSPSTYTGSAGTIFSVTLIAKKAGTADLAFTSGVVLAADGLGTNIFSGYGHGKYTIEEQATKPTEEKPPTKPIEENKPTESKGIMPPIPEVTSDTHPDKEVWYANNNPQFAWKILSDLTNVSYTVDQEAISDPGNRGDGISESNKFDKVTDGINYFHIKFQNKSGWGQAAHRKFMVDVTPPESFNISIDNGNDTTNPTPKLVFKTKDVTSGIDYFESIINGEKTKLTVDQVSAGYYKTDPLAPGQYQVTVIATDKAKNSASSTINFSIDPLKPPVITSIPQTMNKKEELVIQGTSFYSQVTVKIYLLQNNKEQEAGTAQTDDSGNWSFFYKNKLENGTHEVYAKIIDNRGAQSLNSTKHILTVISPSIISSYGLIIILALLFILMVLIVIILYLRNEYEKERERIKMETDEVKEKLRKIFTALREEVDELIELVDKKPGFSENERKVKEKLQESLYISEEFINKEVDDIEKEIKLSDKDFNKKK